MESCLNQFKFSWDWDSMSPILIKELVSWRIFYLLCPGIFIPLLDPSLKLSWHSGHFLNQILSFIFLRLAFEFLCCLLNIWACFWVNFQNEGELGKLLIITKHFFYELSSICKYPLIWVSFQCLAFQFVYIYIFIYKLFHIL